MISDPACGSGGFLVSAYEWLLEQTKGGAIDRAVAKGTGLKAHANLDVIVVSTLISVIGGVAGCRLNVYAVNSKCAHQVRPSLR
jgi:hypothetical protein